MLRLSKKEDYAIILINCLAKNYNKKLTPLSKIASKYSISTLFLRNVANKLRQKNIIKAIEGKNGGYFLQKDPKLLTVGEVLNIFSNNSFVECCSSKCSKEKICEPGFAWRRINNELLNKIYNLSFAEFISKK